MKEAARRYKELMSDLLLQRELKGGQLPAIDEAQFVADLDECWHSMTDAEQAEVEEMFAPRRQPKVTRELSAVERPVAKGARNTPRRAA
jgi:hypothetical protein